MSRPAPHVYVIQGRNPADYADCQAALAPVGARMTVLPFIPDEGDVIARTRDADALIVVYSPMTRGVMAALEGLRGKPAVGVREGTAVTDYAVRQFQTTPSDTHGYRSPE